MRQVGPEAERVEAKGKDLRGWLDGRAGYC